MVFAKRIVEMLLQDRKPDGSTLFGLRRSAGVCLALTLMLPCVCVQASYGESARGEVARTQATHGQTTHAQAKPPSSKNPAAPPVVEPIPAPELPPPNVHPGPNGLMPGVKRGSINDVNAVGDRNIGGRGLGNWYSERAEVEMGREYAAEIDKSTHFITDPVVDAYINRIGQNLVRNSDAKVPFTIKVIDSNQINAFALPGGFFYVNSGLILAADNEAELAAVMAHEIAHVAAHHAVREMTREHYAQIGSVPLIFLGGWAGYGIYEASNLAIPLAFLQFSRDFEAQADYLGTQYLYRAGYDPTAMISFFEKIEALEKQKPGAIARAFDTHPQTPDRIEATEYEIAHILPPRSEYLENTSEFEMVKARLARIENRRKLKKPWSAERPSLRHANTGTPADSMPPTLHRPQIDGTQN